METLPRIGMGGKLLRRAGQGGRAANAPAEGAVALLLIWLACLPHELRGEPTAVADYFNLLRTADRAVNLLPIRQALGIAAQHHHVLTYPGVPEYVAIARDVAHLAWPQQKHPYAGFDAHETERR